MRPALLGIKGRGPFCFCCFFGVTRHMARDRSEDEQIDENEEATGVAVEGEGEEAPEEPLNLDVQVTSPARASGT